MGGRMDKGTEERVWLDGQRGGWREEERRAAGRTEDGGTMERGRTEKTDEQN